MKEIINLPLITAVTMACTVATGCNSDSQNSTSSTNDTEQQEAAKYSNAQYGTEYYNSREERTSNKHYRTSRSDRRSNNRPVADIAGSHIAFSGETVTLDGTGSYDDDGDQLRYFWRQAKGPAISLDNRFDNTLTFVAPQVSEPTQFAFYLIVYDGKQADLAGFSLQISPVADNTPPSITHRYPTFDHPNIPTKTEVSVTFDEALSESSIDQMSLVVSNNDTQVPGNVSYDNVSHTIIFSPDNELVENTQYTVSLGEGIEDIAGNSVLPESWGFTTATSNSQDNDGSDKDSDDGSDDSSDKGSDDSSDDNTDKGSDDSSDDSTDKGSDDSSDDSSDKGSDDSSDDSSDKGSDDNSDDSSDKGSDDNSDDSSDKGSDDNSDDSSDKGSDDNSGDGTDKNSNYNLGSTTQETIDACMDEADKQMLTLVNNARAQTRSCGTESYQATTALAWNCQLETAAYVHSASMADNNYFSHTGEDGSSPGDRISAAGYTWRTYGENIAAGYKDAESVMDGWLTSPGHCANLMNSNFKDIGASVVTGGGSYGIYWTQDFAAQ